MDAAWDIHSDVRSAILGAKTSMNGPLWHLNAPLARAISATMPSGDSRIVSFRAELCGLIGDGTDPPSPPVASEPSIACVSLCPRPWPLDDAITSVFDETLRYYHHSPHRIPFRTWNLQIQFFQNRQNYSQNAFLQKRTVSKRKMFTPAAVVT